MTENKITKSTTPAKEAVKNDSTSTKEAVPVKTDSATKETKKRKVESTTEVVSKKKKVVNESPEVKEASVITTTDENPEDVVETCIDELLNSLKEEQDRIKAQLTRLRMLDRAFNKMKTAFGKKYNGLASTLEKKSKKKAKTDDDKPKTKSGFSKPAPLSEELAKFMGLPSGSLVSRTDATKAIINYVKQNNLEEPENRRHWNPDATLNALLKPEKFLKHNEEGIASELLGYFNVQKCISHHFPSQKAN
jgi:hypothetical protein